MIFNLHNNAFFLQTTRERMRPATVFSSFLISIIILVLIGMNVFVNGSNYASPSLEMFWNIACAQGFLLFGLATWSTAQMASRERNSGTLDFHRASPASASAQTLGLLIGAPSLEWTIFLFTLPMSLFLAAGSPLGLFNALGFYLGFIFTVFLVHLIVIFLNLNHFGLEDSASKRLQNTPLLIIGVFLFFILPFMFRGQFYNYYSQKERISSVSSHIIGSPSWQKIETMVNNLNHPRKYDPYYHQQQMPHSYLFNFRVSEILLQLLVQIPLCILLALGIIRIIRIPHLSPLSKDQLLLGSAYMMFILIADSFLNLSNITNANEELFDMGGFIMFVSVLGYISAVMITPKRLTYSIGLRKIAQLNQKTMDVFDDHNSNYAWMICFVAISLAWFVFFLRVLPHKVGINGFLIMIIGLLQIGSFACALEAFYLSHLGNKRILFLAGLSIPWVFMPIFFGIIKPLLPDIQFLADFGSSLSPFYLYNLFFVNLYKADWCNFQLIYKVLAINLVVFAVALGMSYKQRLLLREKNI